MNVQDITVDLSKKNVKPESIVLRQGDKSGTTLRVKVLDNGTEVSSLSGYAAKFIMKLPYSEFYYEVEGTISGIMLTFVIDESYAAVQSGVTNIAYVALVNGDVTRMSANNIRVEILPSALDGFTPPPEWTDPVDDFIEEQTERVDEVVTRAIEAAEAAEGVVLQDIPTMSSSIKGGAKLGSGLSMNGDVLSADEYELEPATTSRLGGVKPDGTTVTVDSDGTIHSAGGGGAVSGVKGNAETNYRTGNVNITPANIGVESGAEVNQNAFSNVKVGNTTVAADIKTDTIELVAGSNVILTPDAANDKVTIAAKDTTYIPASSSPIMDGTATVGVSKKYAREDHVHPSDTSKVSFNDLNGYAPLASPVLTGVPTAPTAPSGTNTKQIATTEFVADAVSGGSLPTMSSTTKGGAKLGSGLSVSNDVLSVDASTVSSGILPVSHGGTGESSVSDARAKFSGIPLVTCSNSSTVTTKVVIISGFTLYNGARISVKFTYGSNTTGATSLSVNGVSYPIYVNGYSSSLVDGFDCGVGSICEFIYNDGEWHYIGNDIDGYSWSDRVSGTSYPLYIWDSTHVSPESYSGTYPISPCFVYYVPNNGLYYCENN